MANRLTRAFKQLTTKGSDLIGSFPLTSSSNFNVLNSFFNFSSSKTNAKRYTDAYGSNPLVYMIVKKIAFTSASIKRVTTNEAGEEQNDGKILQLLNSPNPDQGRIEFTEQINEYLSTTGNAYVRFVKGVGMGEELHNLIAQNVKINCNSIGQVISYTYSFPTDAGNIETTYPAEEILHLKTSNIVNIDNNNIKLGLSPLQAAWIVVQSSNEKFNAEASIFKNRGIIGILTSSKDTPMLPKERQRLQDEFDGEVGGSDKYNKIKISSTSLEYIQTGMSPSDLKLLDGIISSLRILCSIYGMPSVLFNDNERSTFNNFEQAVKIAYNDVYIPLANKVDRELSMFLNKQLGTNEFIAVDLTSIEVIKASTNEVAQALNSMSERLSVIAIQSLTDDEVRDLIGLGVLSQGQVTIAQSAVTPPTDEN